MLSSYERRKLLQATETEPVHARLTLAKCAAGLTVVTLLAVFGASEDAGRGSDNVAKTVAPAAAQYTLQDHEDGFDPLPQAIQATAAPGSAAAVTPASAQPAQQHRKQVFDQRRARVDSGADRRSVVSKAVQPANRLSTVFR